MRTQGAELRQAGLGARLAGPPGGDTGQIDGQGDEDVLQMGLRQTDVAGAPQAIRLGGQGDRAFNALALA